jgi:hypothetical protein
MSVTDIVNKMNLGTAKASLQSEPNSPLHIMLLGIHQEVVDRLGKSVEKHGAVASNRLKQSIVTVDQSKSGNVTIGVTANFYWKYVNYGVNGTKVNRGAPTWGAPPSGTPSFKQAILGWIRDKGITARPGQTYDQMAFAIMKGIKENGMEARPFFTDVVNAELKKYLSKSISEVMKKAIIIEITDPWQ